MLKKLICSIGANGVKICGLMLVVAALAVTALAGGPPFPGQVPEIDPASIASAVTLLIGGMLMFRGRLRSR